MVFNDLDAARLKARQGMVEALDNYLDGKVDEYEYKRIISDYESLIKTIQEKPMPRYTVITVNYKWEYDVEEREGFECKKVGVITRKGFQDRCQAIASGEWKPKNEPKCWYMSMEGE